MDAARQSVEQCAGEPFVPEYLRPLFEGQVTADELRIETMFPADDATDSLFRQLAKDRE